MRLTKENFRYMTTLIAIIISTMSILAQNSCARVQSVSGELKPGEELTIEGEGERIRGGATLRCWSTDEDRGLDVCVKAFELGPFCFPLPGKLVDAFCESPEDMPDDAGDAGDVPETDTIDGDTDASEGDTVTMLYWRKYRVV